MAWHKGKAIPIAALAVALLIAIILLLSRSSSESRSVRLADGTEVLVRQVTYGKKHRLADGPVWRQILERMPTNFTAGLGIRPRIDFTKDDTLVVWLEWRNGANKARGVQWLSVIDSNGLASLSGFIQRNIYHSNNTMLAAFHFRSFPRQQRTL